MSPPYRVLVVDDSAYHRQLISGMLSRQPLFEVIGEAANGGEAIKEVIIKAPDLITLDIEMPGMDGFTFLRWLMFAKPTPTVMVTSRESNRSVFKALELGAVDFLVKSVREDSTGRAEMEKDLIRKLTSAASADVGKLSDRVSKQRRKPRPMPPLAGEPWRSVAKAVVIASSTGGPPAIQTLFQSLPEDYPIPIIVNQHMPAGFTSLFAKRLAGLAKFSVAEAEDRGILDRGGFIVPGGHHMILEGKGSQLQARILPSAAGDRYIPSADKLLLSAADVLRNRGVGIILTGMGDDGVIGLAAMKRAGSITIAEAESTCVVYGMPRVAAEKGIPSSILPLHEIPDLLLDIGRGRRPAAGVSGKTS